MKGRGILAAVLLTLAVTAGQLRIGWATNDISTDKPVQLAGTYNVRVSKGLRDPLMTTALAMDDGNDCVVFLSLVLLHVPPHIAERVR